MYILCSDLESVFLPELWIEVAQITGIEELKTTTRDVPDLDDLMKKRLEALKENNIGIDEIKDIMSKSEPLEGAVETLNWLRERLPVIILSDAFWELVQPLVEKLKYPTIICNSLKVNNDGLISGYNIREDGKKRTVRSFQGLDMKTIAMGDSYNDVKMISEADIGFFFNASEKTAADFPEYPSIKDYEHLKKYLNSIV
ncbi:MAG: bifunctional phosphoserine phosphatase/homoserine phosphotransferase ThrH [Patescibacteria group bacterium]